MSPSIYCEDESYMGACIGPYVGKTLDNFQYAESLGVALREGVLVEGGTIGMKRVVWYSSSSNNSGEMTLFGVSLIKVVKMWMETSLS